MKPSGYTELRPAWEPSPHHDTGRGIPPITALSSAQVGFGDSISLSFCELPHTSASSAPERSAAS